MPLITSHSSYLSFHVIVCNETSFFFEVMRSLDLSHLIFPYSLIKALRFSLFSVKLARCKSKATRIDLLVRDLGTHQNNLVRYCVFFSLLYFIKVNKAV